MDMSALQQLWQSVPLEKLVTGGLRITIVLLMVWLATKAIRLFTRRLEAMIEAKAEVRGGSSLEGKKRVETLIALVRQGVVILLWVVALLIILRELGLEIAPILASAGIVGLAVGFGAQNLVRDVISGFFFILENQIRVGDVASINGTGGLVEEINFRTIVLRDLQGRVHIFPNGSVTTMTNLTREWSAYVFDIGVAYKEDTDRVVDLLKQVGTELRADEVFGSYILEDIEVFGVEQLADNGVIIRGRIKTLPIHQWEVGREFLRRVKKSFDQHQVEIPFPHRSLYFGEDSKPIEVLLKPTGRAGE